MSNSSKFYSKPVPGCRDVYPIDMHKREWVFNKMKKRVNRYGYKPYDCPVMEYTGTYQRKSGDDITRELFLIKSKKTIDGALIENYYCLRPEITPSVVRIVNSMCKTSTPPIRLYTIGQCFRNENISKCRLREHFQLNVDIFYAEPVYAEIEILDILVNIFSSLGFTSDMIRIKLSHRGILTAVFKAYGIFDEDTINKIFNVIDKIKKVSTQETAKSLMEYFDTGTISIILEIVKSANLEYLLELFDKYEIRDNTHVIYLLKVLNGLSSRAKFWFEVDLSIVRGLSYYTGIVFEAVGVKGTSRSICGGGRYDNIFNQLGYAKNIPVVGFGMGDVVLNELLDMYQLYPKFSELIDYLVIPYDESLYEPSMEIANLIRNAHASVVVYSKFNKLFNAYKYASKTARYAILIAPNEYLNDCILLKNLSTGIESKLNIKKFIDSIS